MTEIAAKYRPQTQAMVASLGGAPQAAAVPAAYGAPATSAPPAANQPPVQSQSAQQSRYSDNRYADYYSQRQQPVADRVAPPIANQVGPQFGAQGAPQGGPSFNAPAGSMQPPPSYQPPSLAPQVNLRSAEQTAEVRALQERISRLEALVARDEEVLRKLLGLLVEKGFTTREEILERLK